MKFSLTEADIAITPRTPAVRPPEPMRTNGVAASTAGDVLEAVTPYIAADLISPDHLVYLKTIADQLSGQLTNYFGFECRLGEEAPLADILFCVRQLMYQPTVLAGQMPGIPAQWTENEPVWQQLREFGKNWSSPASLLFRKVQDIWLEFDVAGSPEPVPIPSLFFGSKIIHSGFPTKYHSWISRDAVQHLTGRPLSDTLNQTLLRCIDTLPRDALLFQMGAMLSREPAFVRICISRLGLNDVLPYLEAIGWDGDKAPLTNLLNELTPYLDTITVDLDLLENGIGPKIGLECAPKNEKVIDSWFTFLDYLVAQELCLPNKRDGLIAFAAPSKQADNIVRGLHHIKLVTQAGKPTKAKAYLSVVSELNQV